MNDDDKINLLKEKVKAFLEHKIPVHIGLNNYSWLNGNIMEVEDSKNFFLLNDRKIGKLPVFYSEIFSITKLEEKANDSI